MLFSLPTNMDCKAPMLARGAGDDERFGASETRRQRELSKAGSKTRLKGYSWETW